LKPTVPWPNDADGDVLRRMEASGFDFSSEHVVDFNIDTESWPPPDALLVAARRRYPNARVIPPENGYRGYIQFQVTGRVTYDFVMSIQREASNLARPFGGICESWGVMQQ
jgi:hypothetical protein